MAYYNNVLVVCRDLKSVRKLSSFRPQTQSRYILASNDPRVHETAKRYSWIDDICWIEQMESFYNVADNVIRLTEAVNEWLKTLANNKYGFPEELLFFTRIAEGGMTTQRIQDALLLIRSYFHLFSLYHVDEAIFILSRDAIWEDRVFVYAARVQGIQVRKIRCSVFRICVNKLKTFFRPLVYEPYFLANYLKIRYRSFRKKNRSFQKNEILFQLCSSGRKHIENIIYLMKSLNKRKYSSLALCWAAAAGAKAVRQQGLRVDELENWLSVFDWGKSVKRMIITAIKARARKQEFISHPVLKYLSVPLGPLLWYSVYHLLFAELAQRYRLKIAAKAYFMKSKALAIKLWGRTIFPQGKITWNCINNLRKPMMLFHYSIGVELDTPYASVNEAGDLWLVAGQVQKELFVNSRGISSDKAVVVGQSRYSHLRKFKDKITRSMSFLKLHISSDYSFYVLYDYPGFTRGFYSKQEILLILFELFSLARENKNIAIIIKPHPSAKTKILTDMLHWYSLPNLFVLDRTMLPYHALNCADLLITKFSTLAMEAMIFEKPIISAIFDLDKRWQIYKDAAFYVFTVKELSDFLCKIVRDKAFFWNFKKSQLKEQEVFLKSYLNLDIHCHVNKEGLDSSELAAEAIERHLSHKIRDKLHDLPIQNAIVK